MNHGYFDYGKKSKDPQFEPHAGIKMAQVLGSPVYIYERTVYQLATDYYMVSD